MIDGKNVFDQSIKNNKVTYENIRKIAITQGDDYMTGCLLDYSYFKGYSKFEQAAIIRCWSKSNSAN